MAHAEDHVWRLPVTVKGGDAKLNQAPSPRSLSPAAKARLGRIVARAPEAMVKLTGRSRGGPMHLKAHLDYITRNGRLQAETQDGEKISDRAQLRALHDDWLLANAAEARGRPAPNATQSVAFILSMPPGTPPDRVEAAARTWARETFAGTHDWLMARHDDTGHPHVHVTVRAVGRDGRRLAPGPADLQRWRERFAHELRRLGVEAEATPRRVRGLAPNAVSSKAYRAGQQRQQSSEVTTGKESPTRSGHSLEWDDRIQDRQEAIRRSYLRYASFLSVGTKEDRQLATNIRRFVMDMPMSRESRKVLFEELKAYSRTQISDLQGRMSPEPVSQRESASTPSLKPPGRG